MTELAIKVENVKKQYRLGAIGGGTLSADIQSWWARRHHREDPNLSVEIDQTKINSTFYALDGINFEIKKGETVGIIGSNGAGKSTLLKLLSRVTAPTEGVIGINGRLTSMLEVGTGFHPELTGRENIYMNGSILGMTKKEIDEKIDDIIEFSECRQFIDTPVKRYSSGMYVKLGFAVASHLESDIMIIDEVLAVGDVKFQQKCIGAMLEATEKEGKTILYVSHNMATIKQLCKRCIVLKKGKIVFDGDTSQAIDIYLERDLNDNRAYYDLNNSKRLSDNYAKVLKVKSFEFVNHDSALFEEGSSVECEIKWELLDNIDGFQIHLVIYDEDYAPVGVMDSDVRKILTKNNAQGIRIKLDLSNLRVGKYSFVLNVLNVNFIGGVTSYDEPNEHISFEITESGKDYQIEWNHNIMGSVMLNKIEYIG